MPRRALGLVVAVIGSAVLAVSCSSDDVGARTCPSSAVLPDNPQPTDAQVATAETFATSDALVRQIVGDRSINHKPGTALWLGDCGQVLGAVVPFRLDRPASGTVDHPAWQCIDGTTRPGIHRTDISGMTYFWVRVDMRIALDAAAPRVAAVDVGTKLGPRIAASPYPDEGLACRTGD